MQTFNAKGGSVATTSNKSTSAVFTRGRPKKVQDLIYSKKSLKADSVLIGWDAVDNASSYRIEIKDKREWDAGHEIPPEILEEAWPNNRY